MKSTLLFLFAALQAGFLSAQFDENYIGKYKTDDGSIIFHILENGQEYSDLLTAEQRQYAVFVFIYEVNVVDDKFGAAMKKGGNYVSCVTESLPQLTFVFRSESGKQMLDVTEESGKKMTLSKMVDPYYYDEETYSDYEGYSDEESGDVDYYDDEETAEDLPSVFQFTRADQGELLLFMKNDLISISLTIPATKSCPELEITGDLVQQEGSQNTYFYTDPSGYKLKAEMISKNDNSGWKFSCASGKCPDANNKCGMWKEEFMLGY